MANSKLAIIGGSGLYDVEEFKERELVDLRKYVHEYVMSYASEDFFIIGFPYSWISVILDSCTD